MKKRRMLLMCSLLVVVANLAACSMQRSQAEERQMAPEFSLEVSNATPALEDGELTYALVSDTPFEGTLNRVFYSGSPDATVMQFFDESLLATDAEFLITNEGAATYAISDDNKTITLTIKDGVKWSDGEPVKASDLLYTYQLLGHPDYVGTRYTFMVSNVEGMPAYHNGETKEISGISVSADEKTIAITFTEATPSILSGIWTVPTPRHHIGDVMTGEVTIEEIMSSDKIRKNPIGFGPYKITKIVPGESVLYERNENYWRGRPALQSIVLKVVSSASILEVLKKGEADIASIPADQYENAKAIDNIEILADVDTSYTYIGFKLGKWDARTGENRLDPNAKLADKRVRQAMWHAMDTKTIGEVLYHGLRFPATSLILPTFKNFYDASVKGRPYNPEKAKALLDEAGFVDVDGDGFREDAEGKPLVLHFASMSGGEMAEPIAQYYIQNWADVGLNVKLVDGRLHEFNSFYDRVQADDPKIDLFQAAWGTGTDPDPAGLYGRTAAFNYSRYTSAKNDELLAAGTSEKAFDIEYRRDIYNEWQQLMWEDVPIAPTDYRYALIGVNKRVVNFSIDPASDYSLPWVWGVAE
ncbi:oligopeptide ABC transporter substrate-binding protein [Sporosarcina sp. ACRSM]|uniref:oligopeptide ABC transporter substrate-binding protein n=1 Tax=Sporosarcina sp. ACRSM TaxID=2918216 RepID=UPI001EF63ADC|nr:oligopeptide ABC transporter substrate-binding protein [Sporosarcina sp. ACRSM]MCG7335200.1 oligopeptide ABC transporter substrate-binding protein [Sporosarcina sp. ACRSM]